MSSEILAPAGTMDALTAAVRCGADAVYLGYTELNARRGAGNFDREALAQAVHYCHARGVKVFLTLNTLVGDDEMHRAAEIITLACRLSVDGLIIQDLGVAALAQRMAPEMFLSASTQLSIHTPAGLRFLAQAGFSRAVLARELSFEEIRELARISPIELEVFVHGALCMCVSGQCYLSGLLGSRSGNRGLCAQPCRLPFAVPGGTGFDLSLKDLSVIKHLPELRELGIASFKIEGRMKRPEYVAAAVSACKSTLEGKAEPELQEQLRAVFSRSGFTSGYYDGRRGRGMFGIRQKEDVVSAAPVLASLARRYDREMPLHPVDFALTVFSDEPLTLAASAGGKSVFLESKTIPELALNRPLTEERAEEQLKKCGGTPFYTREIDCEIENGLSVPMSALNSLRREALDMLLEKLAYREPVPCTAPDWKSYREYRSKRLKWYARFDNPVQIPKSLPEIDAVILPAEMQDSMWAELSSQGIRLVAELPRVFFGKEESLRGRLRELKKLGVTWVSCGNMGAVQLGREEGFSVFAGVGSNVYNTEALEYLESCGAEEVMLSFELTLAQAKTIGGTTSRGLFAYGRLPLMITRNCPVKNGSRCGDCKRQKGLTDRKGVFFPVQCRYGASELLNSRPLYLADRKKELDGFDFALLYFTTETRAECAEIMEKYRSGAKAAGEYTRGLYYRGVD